MNKYVVAYWNDHTGELLQEEVEAKSAFDAAISYLQWDAEEMNLSTMKDVYEMAANMDSMINVLEIGKRYKVNKPSPYGKYVDQDARDYN